MISDFNLVGLSKPKSFTCAVIGGSQTLFWPKADISREVFNGFWNYKEHGGKYIARIEHDGLKPDGTPINGKLVEIVDAN